jgi:hypothetical protein
MFSAGVTAGTGKNFSLEQAISRNIVNSLTHIDTLTKPVSSTVA